jgi:tRNA nucleotidyltransferase/poly(A) polymerase
MINSLPHLAALLKLRAAFLKHDRDIRVVGGCVRDLMLGKVPADVDLCTNATPIEQIRVYENHDIRYISTGEAHGTYTVVLYEPDQIVLEITSLRIDTNQDGRHATVEWTHDWLLDLSRRDLTINAMSLTLDNELIDPYNGADDLHNGRVVFVGNAEERIHEDYLRILRWFRFSARYAGGDLDTETSHLLMRPEVASGLLKISRERVWAEMSKILAGPYAADTLMSILMLGISDYIDLPKVNGCVGHVKFAKTFTDDPVALMAVYCQSVDQVGEMARKWKWSADERHKGKFICEHSFRKDFNLNYAKKQAALGANKDWLVLALFVQGMTIDGFALQEWVVPTMPIKAADIVASGVAPGPEVGRLYKLIRDRWIDTDYTMSAQDCMNMLKVVLNADDFVNHEQAESRISTT